MGKGERIHPHDESNGQPRWMRDLHRGVYLLIWIAVGVTIIAWKTLGG